MMMNSHGSSDFEEGYRTPKSFTRKEIYEESEKVKPNRESRKFKKRSVWAKTRMSVNKKSDRYKVPEINLSDIIKD